MDHTFSKVRLKAQLKLIEFYYSAKVGHFGGAISCLDALLALHHCIMNEEDHFILSKGHAAGALYVALWSTGQLLDEDLKQFGKDASWLPGHPSGKKIPGLMFPTGSLGHGPSLAAGLALSSKLKGDQRRVFCLCSDGEWQEGSCWEALIFAKHHKLDNLTILIDQNGWQGFGSTEETISCSDLQPRFEGFGLPVRRVDGHSVDMLISALQLPTCGYPSLIIMDTIKGKGMSYANQLSSHYLPLSDEDYFAARKRLLDGEFL